MSDLYRYTVGDIVGMFETGAFRMHPDEDEAIWELVFWDMHGRAVTLRIPARLLEHIEGVIHDASDRSAVHASPAK